ncbi:MAG: hypothetical protein UIL37_05270 [Clostridia bacterium]|nr:hypothetical protein [Clostridia bacterium]
MEEENKKVEEVKENTEAASNSAEVKTDAPEENTNDKDITKIITEEEKKEIISDFAPAPINIPKYNKEKENAKIEKKKIKNKKKKSAKARKRRKIINKILTVIRAILLFLLIFVVLSSTLAVLLIRVNTSEYSIQSAIRTHNPEAIVIGKIDDVSALNLKQSSKNATIADILRDNAMGITTYAEIAEAVRKSSFSEFVADNAHGVISHLLYGEPYNGVQGKDVTKAMIKNISYIKLVTGVELGESACSDFGTYVDRSHAFDELDTESLDKSIAAQYTEITKLVFSLAALAILLGICTVLIIMAVVFCSGYAHNIIGYSVILSGICVGVLGFLFKIPYKFSNAFFNSVLQILTKSFNSSAILYGVLVVIVGILVLLIGRAMHYDEEEFDDDGYVDALTAEEN